MSFFFFLIVLLVLFLFLKKEISFKRRLIFIGN